MLNTLGILQFHTSPDGQQASRRLETLATRHLGGKSLLEWMLRRVTDAQRLDGVIAVFSEGPCQRLLSGHVPMDVPVFVSNALDPLGACAAALREFPCQSVVLVPADAPFVDPVFIDRLVITANEHSECEYIGYRSRDGRPAVLSKIGMFGQWCRSQAIQLADKEAALPLDRQYVMRYIYSHPERFQLRLLPVPEPLDRGDVRLQIQSEEDWDNALAIFDALGPESLDWQQIAGLLDEQPALRQRMAVMNRADVDA